MSHHASRQELRSIERQLKKFNAQLEKVPPVDYVRRRELSLELAREFGAWLQDVIGGQLQLKKSGDWECCLETGKWSSSTSGWQGAVTNAIAAVRKRKGWS